MVKRIGGEARKFRLHLVIATQKPAQKTLPELVDRLVQIAIDCHQRRTRLDQAIKTWLESIES